MTTNNYRSTAEQEANPRVKARGGQASLSGSALSAVEGQMMYDDDGDPIGRIYTVSEVCDQIRRELGR